MTAPIAGGPLFAIPYQVTRGNAAADAARNERIIEHLVSRPFWFASGLDEDARRLNIAWMLTDPSLHKWEIWRGGELVGLILLNRVVPMVDAVFQFTLLPGNSLVMARSLLRNFLSYVFGNFKLLRISAEVPEQNTKFLRFLRSLGFRLEGELDSSTSRLAECLATGRVSGIGGAATISEAGTWLARFGSRREQVYWDGERYRDVYLLRLLKSEIEPAPPDAESRVARDNHRAPHAESQVPADHPA